MKFAHHSVPGDLGNDRRGSDADASGVTVDQRNLRSRVLDDERITNNRVGLAIESMDRLFEREPVRRSDSNLIDFGGGDDPHRHHCGHLKNRDRRPLPLARGHRFRIAHHHRKRFQSRRNDNNARRHHRTGQRTAADFIDAGHDFVAGVVKCAFTF